MSAMRSRPALRLALLVAALAVLAGCATPPSSGARRDAPRARCLADPNEQDTRPLVFLLCVQSP